MTTLGVISCGSAKLDRPAPAHRLYTGTYFAAQLAWARARFPVDRIRILSAKHGLVGLGERLEPYDLKMGQPGSVTADRIAAALPPGATIITTCGEVYLKPLRAAADMTNCTVVAPFTGAGKMGKKKRLIMLDTQRRLK